MRRQGNFADAGVSAYGAAASGQRMDHSSEFQDQLEAFTPEREQPFSNSQAERQWRWERDGLKVSRSSIYNEGQGVDLSRLYYQGQMDPEIVIEKQSNDPRAQPHQDNMNLGYDDNHLSQTFDGLEQKFMDDITKLAKEQTEAEDAEIARHRGKINAISSQYQEQLAALRARHTSRRDEVLRKESQARQQQYQQTVMMDRYHKSNMGPTELMPSGQAHGFGGATMADASRPHGSDRYDSYGDRPRCHGGPRDPGFEPRGQYPGGRVYDTGSRYY